MFKYKKLSQKSCEIIFSAKRFLASGVPLKPCLHSGQDSKLRLEHSRQIR